MPALDGVRGLAVAAVVTYHLWPETIRGGYLGVSVFFTLSGFLITGRILAPLGTIDYWFSASGTRVHKIVHHYLLEATGGELSIEGDPDAEAIDVAWFPLDDVQSHLTFPNERRIAQSAWERLAGTT